MRTRPLTPERRALAERYRPLAIRRGLRWARWLRSEADDLIGAAELGLCTAAARHESGPVDFSVYARKMIDGEIRHELTRRRHALPTTDRIEAAAREAEIDHALYRAMADLPGAEADVIERTYWRGQSLRQIGAALGVSAARCCRLRARALGRLREALSA